MDITEVSEINVGLVLTKRQSPLAVRSECLISPYDKLMKEVQTAGKLDISDLAIRFGPTLINSALDAAKACNGLGTMADWPKILEETAAMYQAGATMEKLSRKLQNGEVIDWTKITTLSRAAQLHLSEDLVTLDRITPGQMPFTKIGWPVVDEHIGGVPKVGLVIVGGRPGVGKTWFMTNLVTRYTRQNKDKNVAVFSLEMINEEIADRFKGNTLLESQRPTEEEQKRMYFCDKILSGEEIIQKCTAIEHLGLVCIDFADLTIRGEANEGTMSILYKTLAAGAKELGCTIVLLSQLARRNGIPKPSDLRWTGLAEALGWMILMLYDPSSDWTVEDDENNVLPVQDGCAYIVVWKVRGGFRAHTADAPGAICIPFKGKFGWHRTKGKWFTLKKFER
jgi:hypothetical protein